jgi:hypothetical protein
MSLPYISRLESRNLVVAMALIVVVSFVFIWDIQNCIESNSDYYGRRSELSFPSANLDENLQVLVIMDVRSYYILRILWARYM